MTRRKDPLAEADMPKAAPPAESAGTDPVAPPASDPTVPESPAPLSPEADPTPADPPRAAPPPQPQVVVRRGSFVAPLLGGALAALGGFALSHFDVLGLRTGSSTELATLSGQLSEVQAKAADVDRLSADVATLSDRLGRLESAPAPVPPDLSRLDDLDQRLSAIEAMPTDGAASTAALTAKLAELERRLASQPQGPSPELQQQLDAALARLDEAEATATARAQEAEAAAAAAARSKALDALAARLSSGQPFATELQALDDAAVSETLAPLAEAGVPTLSQLQATFPDAARAALRLARASGADEGWSGRLMDFLAAQTGARPLAPMEGDTPEAILSRADFALAEGRVADAVAELQTLDPAVKVALDPWLVQAQSLLAANAALAAARGE